MIRARTASLAALAIASITALSACEPPPPPPPPPPGTTPPELVSKAQYAAVEKGMTLPQVEAALGKKLTQRDTSQWFGRVSELWAFEGRYGDCGQSIRVFLNDNDGLPLKVDSKQYDDAGCEGVVK